MIWLVVGAGAVLVLTVLGVVISAADAARYAPHQPLRGRGYIDERVGDVAHDEIVIEHEVLPVVPRRPIALPSGDNGRRR